MALSYWQDQARSGWGFQIAGVSFDYWCPSGLSVGTSTVFVLHAAAVNDPSPACRLPAWSCRSHSAVYPRQVDG